MQRNQADTAHSHTKYGERRNPGDVGTLSSLPYISEFVFKGNCSTASTDNPRSLGVVLDCDTHFTGGIWVMGGILGTSDGVRESSVASKPRVASTGGFS